MSVILENSWGEKLAAGFESPVETSVDELVSLREPAAALQRLTQKKIRAHQSGSSVSKVLGRGLDFSEVRQYQPGDDVRMIDWNVTARTGRAHTKLFVEEKERPYYIVVDLRSTMQFGTRKMFKSMMAARLAAILGWCAISANERVGGLVYSDTTHYEIKPRMGRAGLLALFRAIVASSNANNSGQAEPSLKKHFLRLRQIVHTGSSVCFLSDFTGLDSDSENAIGAVLKNCDVVSALIYDPLERDLPQAGRYAVTSANHTANDHLQSSQKSRQSSRRQNPGRQNPGRQNPGHQKPRLSISTGNKNIRSHYRQTHVDHCTRVEDLFSRFHGRYLEVSTDANLADTFSRIMRRTSLATD